MTTREGTFKQNDNRFYRDPLNPLRTYVGVTSVLNARNKPFLTKAKVNAVARYAAKHRKELAEYTRQEDVYNLLRDQSIVSPDWGIATQFGTATDTVIMNLIEGKPLREGLLHVEGSTSYPVDNDFIEWAPRWWDLFVKKYNVEVINCQGTVVNDQWLFGGSYDLLLKVDDVVTLVDLKTNAKGPHGDVAIQQSGYAHCPHRVDMSTGMRYDMPTIEQTMCLWMRPEGFNVFPLQFDDEVWRIFYALLIAFNYSQNENDVILDALEDEGIQIQRFYTR